MSRRVRMGVYTAGVIVLFVLLLAGFVWRAEGVTIERVMRPAPLPNVAVVTIDVSALPGIHVFPGTNVAIKCTADNDGETIAVVCKARQLVRAK